MGVGAEAEEREEDDEEGGTLESPVSPGEAGSVTPCIVDG